MKSTWPGIEGLADVLLEEAEAALAREMAEVGEVAGAEVVDADDRVPCGEQRVTEVGAEKAGGSGDKNVFETSCAAFLPWKHLNHLTLISREREQASPAWICDDGDAGASWLTMA